jgi:hypothetical protein
MSKTLLLFCTLLYTFPTFAADLMLRVHNQTFLNITSVYVSPSNNGTWQENLLAEGQVIKPNTSVNLTLKNYTTPFVDVRAIDESHSFLYKYNVNARSENVEFSVEDKVKNQSRDVMENKALEKLMNQPQ